MRRFFICTLVLLSVSLSAQSRIYMTAPASTSVPQTFLLSGSTFGGTDFVHVWAFPSSGPIFLGQGNATQPDGVTQLASGSFSVQARNLPVGSYPIVVYAHNATTNSFDTEVGATFTVRPCLLVATCYPFLSPGGVTEFWFVSQCQ